MYVRVVNLTNLFNRELFMYSLGDIRFKKPVALKKVAYTLLFFLIWSLPVVLLFGLHFNPFFFTFAFGIPLVLGHFASKPVFGGKSLLDFIRTLFTYLGEPKGWADFRGKDFAPQTLYVENEVWISRRRELSRLATTLEAGRP